VTFKVPTRTEIELTFADGSGLDGARVLCRSATGIEFDEMAELSVDDAIARLLADFVVEWDLADGNGRRLPKTEAALRKIPSWVPVAILESWFRGCMTPPGLEV
jgi:hypothetical protein